MDNLKKLAISCGGTGGHFFPGLSVARELNESGGEALLLLGGKNAQSQRAIAESAHVKSAIIEARPLPHGILSVPNFILTTLRGRKQCLNLLREHGAQALLGMGCYATLPPALAAVKMKLPLFFHDGNARIGRANKMLARKWGRGLALSIPVMLADGSMMNPLGEDTSCEVRLTGLPIRRELRKAKEKAEAVAALNAQHNCRFDATKPVILVFGGSLGAQSINQSFFVPDDAPNAQDVQVIHLTGKGHLDDARARHQDTVYAKNHHLLLLESCAEMEDVYSAADFVICRAGGSTVCELACFGKYALLIPFPLATENHQFDNAKFLANGGGAEILLDKDCTRERVSAKIRDFLAEPKKYMEMGKLSLSLARPEAAKTLLEWIDQNIGMK